MRRLVLLTLCILAMAATPALAQPGLVGPGGLIHSTGASVSVTNTATATNIFTWTVPAGMTQGNFAPLHLKMIGYLTTNPATGSVGTANLGCNFGGTTATIALVNAVTWSVNLSAVPVQIDVWLHGYSSAQSNGITTELAGKFDTVLSSTTVTRYNARVAGTTPLGTSNALTCTYQWASAAATNSLVITDGWLVQGY